MKLPDIDRGGRAESLGAERRISTASNFAHALEALGDTAVRFADARDQEAFSKEKNEFLIEQSKLGLQFRSPYQDPKNIPSNVTYEANEDKWVNGQKTTVARSQIPTHEVQTQWMDNFLSQADEKARAQLSRGAYEKWKDWFAEQSVAIRTRNGVAQFDAAQAAEKARVGKTIETLTDAGSYEDAALTIAQSPYHSEAEKIKIAEQIANEAEMRPIQDAAMRDDLATLQQERARLMDPNYSGVLDPDVRQRVVNFIDREQDRAQAEIDAASAKVNERFYSDANLAVDNGQAGPVDIERWYDQGRIKPNQRTALHRRYDVVTRANTQEADYSAMASRFANGEMYASPANPDHKKAVNQYAEQGAEQALFIMVKTGILPDNMRDAFTANAINATDEEAAELVPVWTAIEDAKPQVFSKLNKDTKDVYTLASALYRSGFEPVRAIESARKGLNMPDAERKFYEDRYEVEIKDADNVSALRDQMEDDETFSGGWFSKDMDYAIADLQFEYETAVRTFYIQTGGNLSLAQKAAYNEVKRSYGVTEVGGGFELTTTGEFEDDWEGRLKRPMKYPAEKMTGLPSNQVQELFRSYAADRGYGAEDLYYIDDDETARSADNPSYQVIYHDRETGDFYPLRRPDNTVDRWKPLEWIDQTIQRKREAETAPARERRQEVMESRAENVRAREMADMFDERIMTTPEERQRMQRDFFGNN